MLVQGEIDSLSVKGDAFHFEAKALLRPGFQAQFDLASRTDHTLPWKLIGRPVSEQTGHGAMIQRVPGSCGHLAVSSHFPFWN